MSSPGGVFSGIEVTIIVTCSADSPIEKARRNMNVNIFFS